MQMDYDDSEFSIHNVELTEEVSSTVSPVLRPYDYEDAGHLSFDSLVENEVFLGITGQEDNQWIEEYSRGTSSSVVESRHDNVWSEAASSESVEMLLKSVGQGTLVTKSSDEPGNLATNLDSMDPNLKQDDEFSHALETMVTKRLGGFFETEELHVSDEPGNLATNLNPVLKQEDENNHTLEAMVTNQVEVGPLATEELYVSDEPGSLATHMDPNLKQDDEFSHALETLVAKKVEGFLATEELDVSDEPGSLSINLDPNLKQQDENNHAQDAMVTNKEEEGVLATEELDESDKRGSLATNTDSSLNQDDESNHVHEAMVLDEVVVLATEELDESDERGSLATNTDPSLDQDDETNAHEAMVIDEEVGALVTEELDASDEPGSLATYMHPNLKEDDGNNHTLEAMIINNEEEVLATEESVVSDEPCSLSINLNPDLKQDDEKDDALEAMVTNEEEEGVLATEESDVSDEPGNLATNMDPNLKQDDENNHAQEAMVTNKEEGVLATDELVLSDEHCILATNSDPDLKQDDVKNHAHEATVIDKEVGALVTEKLDASDEPGSLATNTDPTLNQDDENNHAQEAMVANNEEEKVSATGKLVMSDDEPNSLSASMDPVLKQDDGSNHAQEAIVVHKVEDGVLATEEFNVSDEPGGLPLSMDTNLKQDDGKNYAQETMVSDKEVWAFVTDELDASDDPDKLITNVGPNKKQDDVNGHAQETMIINKSQESFDCDEFFVTVTKDSQEETEVSGGKLDTDVFGNICDFSEEKVDGICVDVNHEARNIAVELSENKPREDISTFKIDSGNLDASKECDLERCQSSSEAECSAKNADNPVGSLTAVETCTNSNVKPSNVDSLDKPPFAVDNLVDEESMPAESCNLLMTEACAEVSHDSKCAATAFPESCELNNDFMHEDLPPVTVEDDGKKTSENLASLESNMCSPLKVLDAYVEELDKPDCAFDQSEMGEGRSINDTGINMTNTCSSVELIAGNTDLVAIPKVHSGDSNKDQSPAAKFSGSVQQQINDEVQSSEQHGGTLDTDIAALDSQQDIESVLTAEGGKDQGSEADITILAEPAELIAGNTDLVATPKVHSGDSSKDQNPAANLSDSVQQQINDEVQSSEQHGGTLDMVIAAFDSQQNIESVSTAEGCCKAQGSEADITILAEPAELIAGNTDLVGTPKVHSGDSSKDQGPAANLFDSVQQQINDEVQSSEQHGGTLDTAIAALDSKQNFESVSTAEGCKAQGSEADITILAEPAGLIAGNTDLVGTPKVHSGDSSKDKGPAANLFDSVQQQISDEVQSSEQHGGTLDMAIAALDNKQNIESVSTAEGCKAQGSEADITILAEPAGLIAGNTDLVATPKVHSGDSNKNMSPAAKLSGSVQQQMNDEVPSSEQHGGTLDMDIAALDSQQDIESVSTAEGCKAQGSEADITILAEPGYIDATSPILGVTSSDHHDNEKKEEGFVSDGTCEIESIKVGSMMDCASLSVVETGAHLVHAGEILHETSVENMNAVMNDLVEEANPDDMGGWSTPSTVDPILCDSSTKAGDNSEAGVGMQESISGHHVNMSSEQPVSTDVVLTSECNDSHMGHDEDSSVSMEKLQPLSPLLNTISTGGAIDENSSFPEATEDANPSEDAIDENTSFPEATEDVKPGEGDINENNSLLEATEDLVLTSEYDDNHMGNEEDTSGSMDAVQAVSPPLSTNNAEPFPSTRVESSEGDIENTPLPEATEDMVLTSQCDDSNTRREEDTSVSMDTRVKPSEGAINENTSLPEATEGLVLTLECEDSHMSHVEDTSVSRDVIQSVSPLLNTNNTELSQSTRVESSEGAINENTSLPEAAEHVVLTSECDDSHMKHEDTSVPVDKLDSVSLLLNTNNTELVQSTRVKSIEDAIDENASLTEAVEDVVATSERDDNHMMHRDSSAPMDKLESVSPVVNKNITELSQSARVTPSEGAINENTSFPEATEDVQAKEHSISSNSDVKTDKSFTFEVTAAAGLTETCTGLQLFSASQSMAMEGSCIDFGSTLDPRKPNASPVVTQTPGSGTINAATKERKRRRKSVAKESAEKGKETTTTRSRRVEKPSPLLVTSPQPTSPTAAGQVIQFQESGPKEKVECSVTKPAPISNLPNLNNSTSIFHQPFTNNQQVQLRAQILVYGSLISGMPPDEAHMIAAFEQSDAGRKTWEDVWRACLERVHGQKSQANTPIQQPRADLKDVGYRSPDLGIKHSSILSSTYKGTPPAVSPLIPVPSPLWNMSTPSCVGLQSRNAAFQHQFTPIHHPSYQTTPNPLWLSQSPFLGQWGIASLPGSPVPRFSGSPITEAVKLTPVNVSGVGPHPHSIPVVHSALFSPLSNDDKKASGDPKSRKRKKVSAAVTNVPSQVLMTPPSAHLVPCTGAHNRTPFLVENQTDSVTTPTSIFSTSVTVSAPPASKSNSHARVLSVYNMLKRVEEGNVQEAYANATDSRSIKRTEITTSPAVNQTPVSPLNQTVSVTVPAFCTSFPTSVVTSTPVSTTSYRSQNMENALAVNETESKVEESKLQAENAALLAAAEVSNFQNLWSGLDGQNSSGVVSDAEAKLMSSISAAAAVAKMASAAAKIATNVAEQARLMADEVFQSSENGNFSHIPHPNVVNKATPASILKSMVKTTDAHSNSIISAAREAARRRIEAASAASKHAENLDAIVKAAELAAEAVSQVGKVVAMGDSSALRKFAEAGPEGFWNTSQLSYDQHLTSNSGKKNASGKVVKEIQTLKHGLASPVHLASNLKKTVTNDGSIISNEKDTRTSTETNTRSSHTYVVGHVIPQSTAGIWEEHNIKEGCLVEVYKENGKYKGAWLAANVLNLKDEKALICYTGIQSSYEGSENVKEWVAFEVIGSEEVPSIRIAHPMTTMRFEGARKRRRTAVTDYAWSKGDRVDVWMQDCWREGIVMEPNKIDVTTLTVQFPAQGETSVVRSWHVRPTLIWKDRKWIEWNGVHTSQGELPKEKRMKLGSPAAVIDKRKDKLPIIVESGTHEEQGTLLPLLSSQETRFNVGKNTKPTSNLPTIHKDKARVVFGVPKPGKKQKFMAVSTQYVDDRTNKNITASGSNSLLKFPKSYGARVTKTDAVDNQVPETKSRLKPRKPPVPWFRPVTNRDPQPTDADSVENSSTRQNQTQVGPSSNKRKEPLRGPPAKKGFTFTSKPKSDPPYKGRKLPPPPPKIEVKPPPKIE
ncbi:uncharacterized protein LOC143604625, partial [Bidens hawaiensis]|uniref:uncharacterized protein LOC143604625 n=1 Tax=Bidens hawaiensis TaxID=980011 RepID=UPI00404A76FC